jgi:hypothetical protein
MMKKLETIKRSSRNWEKKEEEASVVFLFCRCSSRSESAVLLRFPIAAIASSSSSSPVGVSAPLDSVTVGGEAGSTVRLWPGWMKRPSGWMDDDSGGRSQGLLHLHPQKYTGAESGVASPKAFIYKNEDFYFN